MTQETKSHIKNNVAMFFYNAEHPEAYSKAEIQNYEKKVDYVMSVVDQALAAERERIVGEIEKMKQDPNEMREKLYKDNNDWDAATRSGRFAFAYNVAIADIFNIIQPTPRNKTFDDVLDSLSEEDRSIVQDALWEAREEYDD